MDTNPHNERVDGGECYSSIPSLAAQLAASARDTGTVVYHNRGAIMIRDIKCL